MKKLYLSLLTVLTILIFPATVFASGSYSLASNPSGSQMGQNGWYLYYNQMPSLGITSGADSSCGGTGTWSLPLNLGGGDSLGSHTLRVFYAPGDSKSNLWVSRDGTLLGTMCNQDMSYTGSTTTVWEGVVKFDAAPPQVDIDTSLNNLNTSKDKVTITGKAFDTDTNDDYPVGSAGKQKCFSTNRCSVLSSVTVNGVPASISGEAFSAEITLSKGLNAVTATAIDNSGQSRKSNSITVLRSDEIKNTPTSGNTNGNNPNTHGNSTSQNQSNNANASNGQQNGVAPKDAAKNANTENEPPTLVKGVVQGGGIGLATVLAVIVVLLILDKFRIIEVKVFSKITDRLSKHKPAKNAGK